MTFYIKRYQEHCHSFYFLNLKGFLYINHEISFQFEPYHERFLAFCNLFMMLVHMEEHSKWYVLMRIQSKFEAGWQKLQNKVYCLCFSYF